MHFKTPNMMGKSKSMKADLKNTLIFIKAQKFMISTMQKVIFMKN